MEQNLPTVSVIIPAKNGGEGLRRALQSVKSQTYPRIVDVVVAAATEADEAMARASATVVRNPSGATPAGLNLALDASRGEIVARCDSHSVLPVDYVEMAVTALQATRADNVGGMQVPVGESTWERAIAAAMRSPLGSGGAMYRVGGEAGPVETVYLGVFRRSTLQALGGFDEAFGRTQDYELNQRIVDAGGLVWFDPSLKVEYRPRGSLSELSRQYFEYGRAKRLFRRKHPGRLLWRQMGPPLIFIALAVSVVVAPWLPVALFLPVGYAISLLLMTYPRPRVAAAIATMHLSWGAGFVVGPHT